jgi:sulfur carrier protein
LKLEIHVNGESRLFEPGATVADVVASLGTKPALLAVERNREIVPKKAHETTKLENGDRIEIVTFVGGG